jgi:hypothetical protein
MQSHLLFIHNLEKIIPFEGVKKLPAEEKVRRPGALVSENQMKTLLEEHEKALRADGACNAGWHRKDGRKCAEATRVLRQEGEKSKSFSTLISTFLIASRPGRRKNGTTSRAMFTFDPQPGG